MQGLFAEFVPQSGGGSVPMDPDAAWAESILSSIKGMKDAARWLLGVVAGWLIVIPELTELRQLLPVERPVETIYLSALLLLICLARILIDVLEVQAPINLRTIDLHDLAGDDLAYVQEWDVMRNRIDPEQWDYDKGFNAFVWQNVRHMTPEEAQRWATEGASEGDRSPLPTRAELMKFGETAYFMRMEEVRAVLLLSQRDMLKRYRLARRSIFVFGPMATLALIVLLGPVTK